MLRVWIACETDAALKEKVVGERKNNYIYIYIYIYILYIYIYI